MNAWRRAPPFAAFAAMALLCAGGCAAGSSPFADTSSGNASVPPGADFSGGGGSSGGTGGGFSGVPALPPEKKVENKYKAPVSTGNFVWSANPTSGRVAYINAKTFDVQTTEAGNGPTYLAAVHDASRPTDDVAIVLNVLSQDATLLRVAPSGSLTTRTYASTADANAWAISPSGRWAIAWTDARFENNPSPARAFSFLAVMDLAAPSAGGPANPSKIVRAGYRPSQIAFAKDDSRAFAVTEEGISVIDLSQGQPALVRQDPLAAAATGSETADASAGDAPSGGQTADASHDVATAGSGSSGTPDVSFTPDGAYALVRQEGRPAITIDSLADGTLATVPLTAAPTDLALSPKGDLAVAVLRDTSTVVLLPIPGILSAPGSATAISIPGETIGRGIVSADGQSVVLFTTAAPVERITVLTLGPPTAVRTVALHASVQAVFPTADGLYVVVLHDLPASSDPTVKGAFSVVPVAQDLPALIEALPAPPTAVALSNDRAIVSVSDPASATYGVYMALMPSLEVRPYPLASPPIAVGIAAGAGRGYVAQDYSEGRITFVDLSEGTADGGAFAARTITGFELNAGIVVGPDQ